MSENQASDPRDTARGIATSTPPQQPAPANADAPKKEDEDA